jgi:hypothetical protein
MLGSPRRRTRRPDTPADRHVAPQVAAAGERLAGADEALRRRVRAGEPWDGRALVQLCSASMRPDGDAAAAAWCRAVVNVQFRLLFDHVWAKM